MKKKKEESGGTRGCINESQFDALVRTILKRSNGEYRCQISCELPFPEDDMKEKFAGKAWVNACREKGVECDFDEDMLKVVSWGFQWT
jgi:hypothetical protein